jgi:hypothetical protein
LYVDGDALGGHVEEGGQLGIFLADDDVRGDGHGGGLAHALQQPDQRLGADHQLLDAAYHVEHFAEFRLHGVECPERAHLQAHGDERGRHDHEHERQDHQGHGLHGHEKQAVDRGLAQFHADGLGQVPGEDGAELVVVVADEHAQGDDADEQADGLAEFLALGDVALLARVLDALGGRLLGFARVLLSEHGSLVSRPSPGA